MRIYWTMVIGFATLVFLATISSAVPAFAWTSASILVAGLVGGRLSRDEFRINDQELASIKPACYALMAFAVVAIGFAAYFVVASTFALATFALMAPVSIQVAMNMRMDDDCAFVPSM